MLDPSSRGMSKQTMLDWMRINHPQTPVKSGISKNEVARLVREMQPNFFPDPDSEVPIGDTSPGTRTPRTSDSLSRSVNSLSSSADDNSVVPPSGSVAPSTHGSAAPLTQAAPSPHSEKNPHTITKKKRPASNELNDDQRVFKRPEIEHVAVSPDPSISLKKDKCRTKSGNSHRPLAKNGTSLNKTIPAKSMSKSISVTITPQASQNPVDNYIPPLIDFSETDWLEMPNPVVGHDIPPIEIVPESESGKFSKKSGVEVFKEERQRVQKIQDLEESIEELRSKLETNEKCDMSVLADEMRREEEVRQLQVRITDLGLKVERMEPLQAIVANLEAEVTRLCARISTAVEDIRAQEEVITKLMTMDEADEDSTTNGSNDSFEL